MRRAIPIVLALSTLATLACAGRGSEAEPLAESRTEPVVGPEVAAPRPVPVVPAGRLFATYVNLTLEVADPVATAQALRAAVVDAGGEVVNLSHADAQSTLYGQVPPDALGRVRHSLSRLPGKVQSENESSNDVGVSMRQLDGRLQSLLRAEVELDRVMRATTDPLLFDAWLVQRELNARERESLVSQIDSMLQQTRRAQLNVTFVRVGTPQAAVARGFEG